MHACRSTLEDPTAGRNLFEAKAADLVGVEVEVERVGLHWKLAPSDLAQRVMFAGGSFEHPLVTWIANQFRAGDHVIDIGAHVGLFTTQFARRLRDLGGGAVTSFEPAPDSVERVRAHLAMNGLTDVATVVEAAVGAEAGHAALRAIDEATVDEASLRSLFGTGDAVADNVEVIAFDDWWNEAGQPAVDVVKVDVEGAELGVVTGMTATLRTARPRLLVVEIKDHISARAGFSGSEVMALLDDAGYQCNGCFSEVIGSEPMRYLDDNFVFTPKA